MNKKLITALLSLTLALPLAVTSANAAPAAPALAILDVGIDDTLPAFQGKIITEVCILEWTSCPNGTNFEESSHAAVVPNQFINLNGFDHGTFMTSTALQANPNINIVFIKIIGHDPKTGKRQYAGEATVYKALQWVKLNATKYNIKAVTMSQGHHALGAVGTDYCPKTPITQQAIQDLIAINVPTFFAVGNNADYKRIDWPSCIDSSISVGQVDRGNLIGSTSNVDAVKLDFFTLGYVTVAGPGGVVKNISGSSSATQVAAAKWLQFVSAKPNATYTQTLNALTSTTKTTVGKMGSFNKLMDIDSALGVQL
jgi:hypothetical protein